MLLLDVLAYSGVFCSQFVPRLVRSFWPGILVGREQLANRCRDGNVVVMFRMPDRHLERRFGRATAIAQRGD
jgi:hypothetical protein